VGLNRRITFHHAAYDLRFSRSSSARIGKSEPFPPDLKPAGQVAEMKINVCHVTNTR